MSKQIFVRHARSALLVTVFLSPAMAGECVPESGQAVSMDGTDWIDFGSFAAPSGPHTIEAWVRRTGTNGFSIIGGPIGAPSSHCLRGAGLSISDNSWQYLVDISGCDNTIAVNASTVTPLDEWTHVAGSYDGAGTMRLYVNGVLSGERGSVPYDPWSGLAVGAFVVDGMPQEFLIGDVDELRIWNISRSQSEIQATMNIRLVGHETGLIGLWHFDEGAGQVAFDSLSACVNGVFGGDPGDASNDPIWIDGAPLCQSQADADADGVVDGLDNCVLVANPGQRDSNGDGFGNLCDPDLDGDGIVNFADLDEFKDQFFCSVGSAACDDADLDGDGRVNFADLEIVKARFFGAPGPSALGRVCL